MFSQLISSLNPMWLIVSGFFLLAILIIIKLKINLISLVPKPLAKVAIFGILLIGCYNNPVYLILSGFFLLLFVIITKLKINLTSFVPKPLAAVVMFSILFSGIYNQIQTWADASTTVPGIKITKLFDGTVPFDSNDLSGNDSSGNNNRVRAGQLVSYRFDFSINDPLASTPTPYQNISFTTTPLTLGYTWDKLPLFCSGVGSAITGDGITTPSVLICNSGTHSTGDAWSITANVRALPTLVDGSTFVFDATVKADTVPNTDKDTAPVITGTAAPKIDVQKGSATWRGTKVIGGKPGGVYTYGIGIKLKPGSELPKLPITLTDDISGLGPTAQFYDCGLNGTYANGILYHSPSFPYGKPGLWDNVNNGGLTTSVEDSGTISCIATGQSVAITIDGVKTNPATFPTKGWSNNALSSGDNWIVSDTIAVWIPYDTFTADNGFGIQTTNKLNDFNPVGAVTGLPNFNGLGDPGTGLTNEQTAADTSLTGTENWYKSVIYRPGPGSFDKVDYSYTPGNIADCAFATEANATYCYTWNGYVGSNYRSGDGVMAANGDWTSLNFFFYTGVFDVPAGSISCTTIDNNRSVIAPLPGHPNEGAYVNVGGNPALWESMTKAKIEYGIGRNGGIGSKWVSASDERDGTCNDGDSTGGTWYPDLASIPGGAAMVTKVRLKYYDAFTIQEQNDYTAATGDSHQHFAIHHKMLATAIAGEFVPNYGKWYIPGGQWLGTPTDPTSWQTVPSYDPSTALGSHGDRVMVVGTRVRVKKTIKDTVIKTNSQLVGTDSTWYLQPTSDSLGVNPSGLSVNVKMVDTIPKDLNYVAGSSACPDTTNIQPVSCEPLVVNNTDGTTTLTWTFGDIPAGQAITKIHFVTSSDSTLSNGETRSNTVVISASNDNSLEQWRTDNATVQFLNPSAFSVSKSAVNQLVEPGDQVEYIMKYKNTGDNPIGPLDLIDWIPYIGDGRNPATNFNGIVNFTNLEQLSGVPATSVKYSKYAPTGLVASDFDPATVNPSIVWCLATEFGNAGCPANFGEVTGFRIFAPIMQSKEGGEWKLTMKPSTLSTDLKGDIFTNRFSARVEGLSLPVISNNVPVRVVLGSIGNYVWNDLNVNGKQDVGELPLSGIIVNLLNSAGAVIKTTTTDATGKYEFTDLLHGDYKVEFIKTALLDHTFKSVGLGGLDSNTNPTTGITDTITLPVGGVNNTIDGGMFGLDPKITIVKKINGDDANTAPGVEVPKGSTMNITFEVKNIGNSILNDVTVTDDKVTAISCPKTSLIPDEVIICTAALAAPDASTQHTNKATVTGTPPKKPDGVTPPAVTATDTANAYTKATPSIKVIKKINGQDADTAPGPLVAYGTNMNVTFEVTNTGDVRLDPVKVTDDKIATADITCPKTWLAPAETMTCSAVFNAPAAGIGHTNTATATGLPPKIPSIPTPVVVTSTNPANALSVSPSIKIIKKINGDDANTAPGILVAAGSTMNITFEVSNTGNVDLNPVVVTDDKIPASSIVCPATLLAVGANMTCSATLAAPAPGVQHTNKANVKATVPPLSDGSILPDLNATDTANAYVITNSSILFVKKINGVDANTAPGVLVAAGTTLNIEYIITNTSDIALDSVIVTDDIIASSNIACPKQKLAIGESITCTASYPAPLPGVQHTNIGTVTAKPIATPGEPNPKQLTVSDPANALSINPSLKLVKKINGDDANTAPGILVTAGSTMNITFEVSNTGNVDLNPVVVTDDTIAASAITCPATQLAVGTNMTCTASYPAPAPADQHTNIAKAAGKSPVLPDGSQPKDVTSIDIANAFVTAGTALTIVKSINGVDANTTPGVLVAPGSTMNIEYLVTNTGNIDLDLVKVTDDVIASSSIYCPKQKLAVGASMKCTATYLAPPLGIQHTNIGTVKAKPAASPSNPTPKELTAIDPANAQLARPSVRLVKKINGDDANTTPGVLVPEGSTMNITYLVTNTGNIDLNPVVVTDDKIPASSIICPATSLKAGVSMTCTATLTAPPAGVQHTNIGTITATPIPLTDGVTLADITTSDPANAIGASAVDDRHATPLDTPITYNPLINDSVPSGSTITSINGVPVVIGTPITIKDANGIVIGTVVVNADGTVTVTPAPGSTTTIVFPYEVTTPTGDVVKAIDTVTILSATITGSVYLNPNNNGIQDPVEPNGNIPTGTTVTITSTTNPLITFTTIINPDGTYSKLVPPGTYTVTVTPPTGYTVSTSIELGVGTGSNPTTLTVADGEIKSQGKDGLYKKDVISTGLDIAITKTDNGVTVAPGNVIIYTLIASNVGTVNATGVKINEFVPANTVFDPTNSTVGWNCVAGGVSGTLCIYTIGNLNTGISEGVFFAVKVKPATPNGTIITNNVGVVDDGTHGTDVNSGNNTAKETTPVVIASSSSSSSSNISSTSGLSSTSTSNSSGSSLSSISDSSTSLSVSSASSSNISSTSGLSSTSTSNSSGSSLSSISDSSTSLTSGLNSSSSSSITPILDIKIVKKSNVATTTASDTLKYTLEYSNKGNVKSTGVTLTEIVPAYTTFNASQSDSRWICSGIESGNYCTLTIGDLSVGTTGTVMFSVNINPNTPTGIVIFNLAGIYDDGTHGDDNNSDDNTSEASTPVIDAANSATITGSVYLNPNNNGTQDATETNGNIPTGTTVTITSTTDSLIKYIVNVNPDGTYSQVVPAGTYTVIVNPPVDYTVSTSTELGAGAGANPTIVTVANGETKSQGKDGLYNTINADLKVEKKILQNPVAQFDYIIYTLKFSNLGINTATGVRLIDTMPTSLEFISASYEANSITPTVNGQDLTFTIPSLSVGVEKQILITAKVLIKNGNITNKVKIIANEFDPLMSNNQGEVTFELIPKSSSSAVNTISNNINVISLSSKNSESSSNVSSSSSSYSSYSNVVSGVKSIFNSSTQPNQSPVYKDFEPFAKGPTTRTGGYSNSNKLIELVMLTIIVFFASLSCIKLKYKL